MTFEELKTIYPDAYLSDEKEGFDDSLVFPYYNKWIHLKKEDVSEKERHLLSFLLDHWALSSNTPVRSQWQAFLTGEEEIPQGQNMVRVIQIELRKKDEEFDKKLWLESIANLFDPIVDIFFLSDELCLVIQDEKSRYLQSEEIEGMLQTVDDDFSTKTTCYIGQYWIPQEQFRNLYEEERRIFTREQKRSGQSVLTFSDVALRYYTEDAVNNSSIMQQLKNYISSQSEWKELIMSLWESRGNVSMAAKSMFIHRNTLQYRIDRFYDSTGLSLRDMNDLIICYMLIV